MSENDDINALRDLLHEANDRNPWLRLLAANDYINRVLDRLEAAEAEVQRLTAENEALRKENHNLNWALGTEGYSQMATPEEQAEHEEGLRRVQKQLDRLKSAAARWEALRRDAERYQWIRKESCIGIAGKSVIRSPLKRGTPCLEFPNTVVAADFRGPDALPYRYNFDSAIDKRIGEERARAALAQAEKGGGNG